MMLLFCASLSVARGVAFGLLCALLLHLSGLRYKHMVGKLESEVLE